MPESFQIAEPAQEPVNQQQQQQFVQQIPQPNNIIQPVQQNMAQQVQDTLGTDMSAQITAVVSHMRSLGVPDDKIASELGITLPGTKPVQNANPFSPQQQPQQQVAQPQVDANGQPIVVQPQVDANGQPIIEPAPTGLQSAFLRGNANNPAVVTPESLPDILTKELNINPTTPEGATQLLSSVRKWRGDSQKFAEVSKQFKEIDNFLESLPPDLKGALSAHANAQPYKGFFSGEGAVVLDYNKTFDVLTPEEVIGFAKSLDINFNITKEDINKPENGILKLSLSKAWDGAKTSFESQKNMIVQQNQEKQQKFQTSADASMVALGTKYQNMFNEAEQKEIRSLLKPQALISALYDKNGFPKADAAEKISFLLYGEQILNDVKLLSSNNGRNQGVIETINSQGSQQIRQRPATEQVGELVDQQMSLLKSYTGKKTY